MLDKCQTSWWQFWTFVKFETMSIKLTFGPLCIAIYIFNTKAFIRFYLWQLFLRSHVVANWDYSPLTLRSSLMCWKCDVPIRCFPKLCFNLSPSPRRQNQRRSFIFLQALTPVLRFNIQVFSGSPSWKSASWPLRAGLLTPLPSTSSSIHPPPIN